ncbi:hypothetical protein DOZ80_17285 [Pseudomonas fluorescens]|uniref:Uncharacterized protein n=1 Tax=Pseudomonas fluorescens TaxID=294 RepID=A0A327N1I3_PSEFL|nr:hypothetical protein DOZ80_17285 [Pseudomonas fluorescens]
MAVVTPSPASRLLQIVGVPIFGWHTRTRRSRLAGDGVGEHCSVITQHAPFDGALLRARPV